MAKSTKNDESLDTSNLSKNFLHGMLASTKGTHFNDAEPNPVIISSGSLKIDNYVKIRSGIVIRMGGPAEVGKTSESLLIADNYMKTLPKSKTIYVNAEAKFGVEIQKRTGMKFTTDPSDWDYGSVFILNSNCFDTICDIVKGAYKQMVEIGEHLCVIVDSVDMLTFKSNLEGSISAAKRPAGVNYLTKEMFRHLSGMITNYDGLFIMITQYSETFTMSKYEAEAPSLMDGNKTHALNHQASVAFYYRPRAKSHYILENDDEKPDPVTNKILGVKAFVEIRKSSADETGYVLEIPIKKGKVGNCVWQEKEMFDVLMALGLLSKKGAWIDLSPIVIKWFDEENDNIKATNVQIEKDNKDKKKEDAKPLIPLYDLKSKHQGLEQFSKYFEENTKVFNFLMNKLKVIHS